MSEPTDREELVEGAKCPPVSFGDCLARLNLAARGDVEFAGGTAEECLTQAKQWIADGKPVVEQDLGMLSCLMDFSAGTEAIRQYALDCLLGLPKDFWDKPGVGARDVASKWLRYRVFGAERTVVVATKMLDLDSWADGLRPNEYEALASGLVNCFDDPSEALGSLRRRFHEQCYIGRGPTKTLTLCAELGLWCPGFWTEERLEAASIGNASPSERRKWTSFLAEHFNLADIFWSMFLVEAKRRTEAPVPV